MFVSNAIQIYCLVRIKTLSTTINSTSLGWRWLKGTNSLKSVLIINEHAQKKQPHLPSEGTFSILFI
jgi:hypothetical protein